MSAKTPLSALVCFLLCLSLVGCGTSGNPTKNLATRSGKVTLNLHWPEATRYIPSYGKSLYFELYPTADPTERQVIVANRPDQLPADQNITFNTLLMPGRYVLAGVCRTEKEGQGETVASAVTELEVTPNNTTAVALTLQSTIKTITLNPSLTVAPNTDLPLAVSAKDPDQRILLLPSNALSYSIISGPAGATLSATGVFRTAQEGTYRVRVEEPVTHIGAEASITCVIANVSGVVKNSDGQPLEGAKIVSTSNGVIVTSTSNTAGQYQLTLSQGTHILSVSARGYTGSSFPVVVSNNAITLDVNPGTPNGILLGDAPTASINPPNTNLEFGTSRITGSFTNADGSGIVQIINGDETLVSNSTGFATTVVLRLGTNTIQYRSSNVHGATLSQPITINYAPDSNLVFRVTMNWDGDGDVDLWSIAPNGDTSNYSHKDIPAGALDVDNTRGYGPENFTAKSNNAGRFRFGVNNYGAPAGRKATVTVTVLSGPNAGQVQSFGPYAFNASSGGGGLPITTSTDAWWRPCDVVVGSNGSVQISQPDGQSFPANRSRSAFIPKKKTR